MNKENNTDIDVDNDVYFKMPPSKTYKVEIEIIKIKKAEQRRYERRH